MTVSERAAVGKAARSRAPRSSHGEWEPSDARADPVAILEAQAESRVPELVPIRYGRMSVSPFAFYRGAAAVMAADLALTPITGLRVQACGDAHLANFGVFAAPDRRLVFDLNDFDETLPGPWEWDVKRLAASFEIAGRENGFKRPQRQAALIALDRPVPRGDARLCRDAQPGGLVRAPRRRRDPGAAAPHRSQGGQAGREGGGEGARQGQHAGAGPAHGTGRR